MVKNILIKIAFDGVRFHGTQKQPKQRTVQGELEKYLSEIYNEEIKVIGSSRTDTGVHALEWPFTIKVHSERTISQLISFLRHKIPDIRILSMETVPDDFHPQYHAISRRYEYRIYVGDSPQKGLHSKRYHFDYEKPMDKSILKDVLTLIKGEWDFSSFTAKEKYNNPVREITYANFEHHKKSSYVIITIEANGFLRWMVRKIIGSIIALNDGKMELDEFIDLLENPEIGKCKFIAEASGLYKVSTKYPKSLNKIKKKLN